MPTKEEIAADRAAFLAEADSFLRQRYSAVFADGSNIATHYDDSVDAFRHCYVSARFAHKYGGVTAYLLGWANEIEGSNTPEAHQMDLFNNARGISYAKAIKDPIELGERIVSGIRAGELVIRPGNTPGADTTFGTHAVNADNLSSLLTPLNLLTEGLPSPGNFAHETVMATQLVHAMAQSSSAAGQTGIDPFSRQNSANLF